MKNKVLLSLSMGFMPLFAFAADDGGTVDSILQKLYGYINFIVPALITIAVIYFIWGVISFMTSSDEEAKKKGRTKIINGLIGLFVIVTFWGIIAVVRRSFNIGNTTGQSITPCVPTPENDMGRRC